MGQAPQPANEAYENVIALAVRRADPAKPIWIEHEGFHVGSCMVRATVSLNVHVRACVCVCVRV
eukprot:SAG22_NODE_1831_length_3478_cov_1.539805_5_plen_64_part_00